MTGQAFTISQRAATFCSVLVLVLHGAYAGSYGYEARQYYRMAKTADLDFYVNQSLGIGLRADYDLSLTLAITGALMTSWHGVAVILALWASLRHRRLLMDAPELGGGIAKLTKRLTRMPSQRKKRGSCLGGCCRVFKSIKDGLVRVRATWREYFTIDGKHYELGAGVRGHVNCYRAGITGRLNDIDSLLETVETSSVSAMRFTHCSTLEMPPRVQTFTNLAMLEVYNSSTIKAWDVDAVLLNRNHPHLGTVWLIRVYNVSRLPAGLLLPGFPAVNVHVCESDLSTLPDDLEARWPQLMVQFAIQRSALVTVPPGFLAVQPLTMSLAGNRLTSLPPGRLGPDFLPLLLSGNPLTALDDSGFVNVLVDVRSTEITEVPLRMTRPSSQFRRFAGVS
ncbi:hypothetical protein Poli38472_014489 [Pythium oligandrum]|uniref:Uncharacterized protein n=1 Tax=Pythium oligandrum TaxID=41045 RepID=A0A8K1CEE9_PYTOL|nr:hypothetical protein Poli38472_014489 [Pythium oligandrum]|eukprot:TMW61028.1 hypothetical protein Poli38472_014489 [Pythium oligandrum]